MFQPKHEIKEVRLESEIKICLISESAHLPVSCGTFIGSSNVVWTLYHVFAL